MNTHRGAKARMSSSSAPAFLPAFPEGLEYVKQDGTFVEVGHFVDSGLIEVNPHKHFLRPNLRLEGVWGSRHHHFVRAMAVMENEEFPSPTW